MIHPESVVIEFTTSSDDDSKVINNTLTEPKYKKIENLFILNKFSKKGTKFSHCIYTSCHKAPSWAGGSWINTWKTCVKPSEPNNILCSFLDCYRKGILGAHVMYTGSMEEFASWYIIPACHKCNRKYGQGARIKNNTTLLKVMKGRVFKPNKILVGSIDTEEYNRVKSKMPIYFKFDNNNKTKKKEFIIRSYKYIREWPEKRLGGWGWK